MGAVAGMTEAAVAVVAAVTAVAAGAMTNAVGQGMVGDESLTAGRGRRGGTAEGIAVEPVAPSPCLAGIGGAARWVGPMEL